MKHTYDCEPTMTDTQVLDFCKKGFLMLEAVVPDEVNKKTCDYCELYASGGPFKEDSVRLPDEIFELDWFADNVILNSEAIGVVRTLLGKNFQLPTFMANHRAVCPSGTGGWHRDSGSLYGPKIDSLKVFYYPQDTPFEMGPHRLIARFTLPFCWGLYGAIILEFGAPFQQQRQRALSSSAFIIFGTVREWLPRRAFVT